MEISNLDSHLPQAIFIIYVLNQTVSFLVYKCVCLFWRSSILLN